MHASAAFNAVRAVVGQKEPIVLNITLRNNEETALLTSVIVKIPFALGFDKAGLMRETRRRLGLIKVGGDKTVPIPIYVRSTTKEGTYPVEIKAITHLEHYDKNDKEYAYSTTLRVIKV